MSVCDAVNDVVEARFRQSNPDRVIKHFVADVLWRCRKRDGKDDSKWQPEEDKCQKAVKVASYEREVGLVSGAFLEAWLAHKSFSVDYDSDVNEKRDEQRNKNQCNDDTCTTRRLKTRGRR